MGEPVVTAPTPSPDAIVDALIDHQFQDRGGWDEPARCTCGHPYRNNPNASAGWSHPQHLAHDVVWPLITQERDRIAHAIKNTPTPHDVFLANESGTWVKARRVFAALARNPEEPS